MQNSTLLLQQMMQFTSNNVNCAGGGATGVIPAGSSSTVDYFLTDDCFLTGGIMRSKNSAFGDYAHFQVIDVNNVLGFGAGVVLGQYLTDWYMSSDTEEQINENFPYPAKIKAGLALRVVYFSIGTTDVTVCVNYRLHKAMY
jgi:hypothetical protein